MRSQGKRQHQRRHHNHDTITAWAPSFDLDNCTVPKVEKKRAKKKRGPATHAPTQPSRSGMAASVRR